MRRHLMKASKAGPKYKVNYAYFNLTDWARDPHGDISAGVGLILRAQTTDITSKALWQRSAPYGIYDKYFLVKGLQPGDILGVGGGSIDTTLIFTDNGIIYVEKLDVWSGFVVWNDINPGPRSVTVKNIIIL